MSNKKYFSSVYSIFQASGLAPPSYKSYFLNHFLLPANCALFALTIYDFREPNRDFFEFVAKCQSVATHLQILIRQITVYKYASVMEELLSNLDRFWNYAKFGEILATKLRRKMSVHLSFINLLRHMVLVVFVFLVTTPLLSESLTLPQELWTPESTSFRVLAYILQCLVFGEGLILVPIFDGLFLLMCAELSIQFRLLRLALDDIVLEDGLASKKLKTCFLYHVFLLKQHRNLNKVSSFFFLLQYVVTIQGSWVEFYVITKSGQLFLPVIYATATILQCWLTYIAASNVEIEAEKIPDAIFGIDWYDTKDRNFQNRIRLMLMRAQKPVRFSAAGMFDVQRNRLVQIMRIAFSISTLLQKLNRGLLPGQVPTQ